MSKSTASHIAYDVRPGKQIERRGIIEILNCVRYGGFDLKSYRYIGMGGVKFIDFHLMSRHIGFEEYVSVEKDLDIVDRCKFNRPSENVEIFEGDVTSYFSVDAGKKSSVYWLDLEMALSDDVVEILNSLAEHILHGDVFFITISAELPGGMRRKNNLQRRDILKSRIPGFKAIIGALPLEKFSDKNFKEVAVFILGEIIKSSFASRLHDGKLTMLMKVIYRDTSVMTTFGGIFSKKYSKKLSRIRAALKQDAEFLCPRARGEAYKIPEFNFTELERILLDKSTPSASSGYTRRLLGLGLREEDLLEYERVSQFVPRYVETAF